jgi:uncharacterized protein (DUF1684 family)
VETPSNPLHLADWRRQVAALYRDVREASPAAAPAACARFRAARDRLFQTHAASPLRPERRTGLGGLAYYPHDPAWRLEATLDPSVPRDTVCVDLGGDGTLRYTRVGALRFAFPSGGGPGVLSLFWVEGYGGGLFLPFRDATSGGATYGGGRYLWDTIKGADLGGGEQSLVLDFNYAYNPSCAYDPRWVCPLAPPENTLPWAVEAGERAFG